MKQNPINFGHSTVATVIEAIAFNHSLHPGIGLEVLTFAEFKQRVPERHQHSPSRPRFHQIFLIEAGQTEHEIDFVRYRCPAGSVLHLRPGQVQQFVRDDAAAGWVLLFRPDFLPPEPAIEIHLSPGDRDLLMLAAPERSRLTLCLRALASAHEALGSGPINELQIRTLQHLLLALLLQVAEVQHNRLADTALHTNRLFIFYRRFQRLIETGFWKSREVEDYARQLGCSTKTLSRACAVFAELGPKRLIEQRVSLEAKRLLLHSGWSVSIIGAELGFSEPTNFIRFFRRCEGLTPAAFRNRTGSIARPKA